MPPKKYNSEEERKAAAAAKRQNVRQQETADQRAERLQRDSEAKRLKLDNETAEQRAARLLRKAETSRSRIDNETAEQRAARLLRKAETSRSRIDNETAEQRAARLLCKAETYRSRIDNETAEQHAARLQHDAEAHRRYRRPTIRTNAIDLANIDEKEIIEFYCGQMNESCEFCNSLNFMGERPPDRKFSACCHKGKIDLPEQDYPEYLETLMNGVDHNINIYSHDRHGPAGSVTDARASSL
ncbi:hypothetical protein LAZ67_X000083 [Cordylochernes scorpioides]|uniref:STPR domain-containing protein n=1 Tax=Cordylochernes scorpioides TaxID=51811 RepID=A0ABY6LSE8_9ARAC|nr:hypothetical protein LAZ67_X000083 [Cordylochernes scorpioides]